MATPINAVRRSSRSSSVRAAGRLPREMWREHSTWPATAGASAARTRRIHTCRHTVAAWGHGVAAWVREAAAWVYGATAWGHGVAAWVRGAAAERRPRLERDAVRGDGGGAEAACDEGGEVDPGAEYRGRARERRGTGAEQPPLRRALLVVVAAGHGGGGGGGGGGNGGEGGGGGGRREEVAAEGAEEEGAGHDLRGGGGGGRAGDTKLHGPDHQAGVQHEVGDRGDERGTQRRPRVALCTGRGAERVVRLRGVRLRGCSPM